MKRDLSALPDDVGRKQVWEAFREFSELPDADARQALSFGTDPLVFIKPLPGANGFFDERKPSRVLFADKLVRRFEADAKNADLQRAVEAKLLHEMVHWGDHKDGIDQPGEEGENFELAAYGRIVPVDGFAPSNVAESLAEHRAEEYQSKSDDPRGIRNNNPGNIRIGDNWQGLASDTEKAPFQSDETAFCVFKAPRWGIRAMCRVLIRYQDQHGLDTVAKMIQRWAPPDDNNNTNAYIGHVAQRMNLSPNQAFDFAEYAFARPMVEAMIQHENGMQPYKDSTLDLGLHLAGIEAPTT